MYTWCPTCELIYIHLLNTHTAQRCAELQWRGLALTPFILESSYNFSTVWALVIICLILDDTAPTEYFPTAPVPMLLRVPGHTQANQTLEIIRGRLHKLVVIASRAGLRTRTRLRGHDFVHINFWLQSIMTSPLFILLTSGESLLYCCGNSVGWIVHIAHTTLSFRFYNS